MQFITFKIFGLVCLLGLYFQVVFPQCDISVGKGRPAEDWNRIFTQNGAGTGLEPKGAAGWTGADSTISLELPNGNTAFFFSDSFISEYPENRATGKYSPIETVCG